MVGWADEPGVSPPPSTSSSKSELDTYNADEILKEFQNAIEFTQNFCCLICGKEESGKTGLLQSYPLADDEKMIIVDLDGGNQPLVNQPTSPNWNKRKNIWIYNPLVVQTQGDDLIDYVSTVNNIKKRIRFAKENHAKLKIRAFAIDGLSTLLKHCEYQMRIEKNITVDGGVSLKYWTLRMKTFTEILEIAKALPMDIFFIAHEDFIATDEKGELSAVKVKTNQMVFQKIRCIRETVGKTDAKFTAIIDKSKFDITAQGQHIEFASQKGNTTYEWNGEKVLQRVGGKKNV